MEHQYTINSPEELEEFSQIIADLLVEKKICIFKGDLGSGKTTLIKNIANKLETKDQVSSPSFSILNEYRAPKHTIYHFDLYRIKSVEELEEIGFFENLDSCEICLIEWPELIEDYLDMPYIEIKISIMANNVRNIIILS